MSLNILEQSDSDKYGSRWTCLCHCGNRTEVAQRHLKIIKSCGCGNKGPIRHGMAKTPIYKIWEGMKDRCQNPNTPAYPNYGGRGIRVCKGWQSFENFYADMGDPPSDMTLDRRNNNGNYEPGNCRWATRREQARNRRSSFVITHDGESLVLEEWVKRTGLAKMTLWNRIKTLHWPIKKALFTPPR